MATAADYSENFVSDMGNYADDGGSYNGAAGSPSVGCAQLELIASNNMENNASGTYVILTGSLAFKYRVLNASAYTSDHANSDYAINVNIVGPFPGTVAFTFGEFATISTDDTGWLTGSIDLDPYIGENLTTVAFTLLSPTGSEGADFITYIDTILVTGTAAPVDLQASQGGIPASVLVA